MDTESIFTITVSKDNEKVLIASVGQFGLEVLCNLKKYGICGFEYNDTIEIMPGSLAIVTIYDAEGNISIAEKLIEELKISWKCVIGIYFDLLKEESPLQSENKLSALKGKADTLIIGPAGSVHEEIIEFLLFLYLNKCDFEERKRMLSNLSNNGFSYFNVVYDKKALHNLHEFVDFSAFETNQKCSLAATDNLFVLLAFGSAFKLDFDGNVIFSAIEEHLHSDTNLHKFTMLSKRYSPYAISIQFLAILKELSRYKEKFGDEQFGDVSLSV